VIVQSRSRAPVASYLKVKMQVTIIYAISYASAVFFLVAWRLSQCLTIQARQHIFSTCSKWLLYTVMHPRLTGSSDVTIMAGSIIIMFIVANIVGCVISIHNTSDLSSRLARMAVTNLVILYLGGSSTLLADKGIRISNDEHHLLHRWIGRVTVVEGLAHGTFCLIKTKAATRATDLAVSNFHTLRIYGF
jgi:hypothetical protein